MTTELRTESTSGAAAGRVDRRTLLRRGAAVGGAVAYATAASPAGAARRASSAATKKIVWIPPLLADFNLPIDVGFRDFADAYGWKYQKIGSAQFDAAAIVNNVNRAIQVRPTVLVIYAGVPGLAGSVRNARAAGITVIANNTEVPEIAALGVPYVGQEFVSAGRLLGGILGRELLKRGRKSGVVIDGNNAPGNLATEQRHQGLVEGLKQFNAKNGTNYTAQEFLDKSFDRAQAIPLYRAKFRQVGSNLAAIAAVGVVSMEAALPAAKEAGFKPGQIPMVAHDTSPTLNDGVKQGWIQALIDQQLYSQGFVSAALGWQQAERGFTPAALFDTGQSVVDKSSIDGVIKRDNAVLARAKKLGLKV
jgi:ABC-type sugar transport system substrate-binding protein